MYDFYPGGAHNFAVDRDLAARALYMDHDPVAVAHSEIILQGNANTRVLLGDLRQPEEILTSAAFGGMIDLSRPVDKFEDCTPRPDLPRTGRMIGVGTRGQPTLRR